MSLILTDTTSPETPETLAPDQKYVMQYGTTQRELAFLDLRQLQLLDTVCPMKWAIIGRVDLYVLVCG